MEQEQTSPNNRKIIKIPARRFPGRGGKLVAALVLLLFAGGLVALVTIWSVRAKPTSSSELAIKQASAIILMPELEKNPLFRYVNSLSWSPDGLSIAGAGESKTIQFWDISTGRLTHSSPNVGDVHDLLWLPQHKGLLAVSSPNSDIKLLDPATGQISRTLAVTLPTDHPLISPRNRPFIYYETEVELLGWSSDGANLLSLTRISGVDSSDYQDFDRYSPLYVTVQVWDVGTGRLVRDIELARPETYAGKEWGAQPRLYGAKLSPDGGTLAVANGFHVRQGSTSIQLELWDLDTGTLTHTLPRFDVERWPGYIAWERTLNWSPNSKMVAIISDRAVRLLDVNKGEYVRSLPEVVPATYTPVPPTIQAIVPTPTPIIVPQAPGTAVRVLPPLPTQPALYVPVPTPTSDISQYEPIEDVVWSPAGDALATGDMQTVRSWDPTTGTLNWAVGRSGYATEYGPSITWSNDGQLLASAELTTKSILQRVVLRDAATGQVLREITDGVEMVMWVKWSPYSTNLAVSYNYIPHWLEIWGVKNDSTPSTP